MRAVPATTGSVAVNVRASSEVQLAEGQRPFCLLPAPAAVIGAEDGGAELPGTGTREQCPGFGRISDQTVDELAEEHGILDSQRFGQGDEANHRAGPVGTSDAGYCCCACP
ncbi:MAG: hypothetical protein L0387_39765 [Acidobacteria bacterium]|nr:hypothetical protein [Acidobacteriota bacterium]